MGKNDKSADAMNKAMQEALDSVERVQAESAGPGVEVDTSAAADEAAAAREAALRDQLLRMAADFDNYRKRARREQDDVRRFGSDRLLGDILPIVDNLDRALAHSEGAEGPVIAGIRMVAKQFHDVLSSHGVKPYDSTGKPFDPEQHEAVSQTPTHEAAPGTVLQELQRGYMIHDRLLRPARVVVAIAPTTSSQN